MISKRIIFGNWCAVVSGTSHQSVTYFQNMFEYVEEVIIPFIQECEYEALPLEKVFDQIVYTFKKTELYLK